MLSAYVDGIGLLGPGLSDWPSGAAILAGSARYVSAPTVLPAPSSLPPAERRRTGTIVKLALAIGFEATSRAQMDPTTLPTVFTSSGGDGPICHEICEVLAGDRQVSPTRFTNSVHNAAAGYWGIAAGSTAASNALCAFDASFAAMTQVGVDRTAVLLLAYDAQYPPPLREKRPIPDAFGVALALSPQRRPTSLARISVELTDAPADRLTDESLEALRVAIPAARSLPILRCLARREPARVVLEYQRPQQVAVEVSECT
jgi:Beta-ketoacyl synthase, N-terminal domain